MAIQVKPGSHDAIGKPHPGRLLTYDEFLEWADGISAEWVAGEVIVKNPVSRSHQQLSGFICRLMSHYVEIFQLGEVLVAPYQMRLRTLDRGREPDILFVQQSRLGRHANAYLDGPADLAIEIVSPDSILRDRGEKYAEYEAAGVREYWIIDPDTRRADFFVLGDDNRFDRSRPDEAGIYQSSVISGFWIDVAWLWQEPLPAVAPITKRYDSDKAKN